MRVVKNLWFSVHVACEAHLFCDIHTIHHRNSSPGSPCRALTCIRVIKAPHLDIRGLVDFHELHAQLATAEVFLIRRCEGDEEMKRKTVEDEGGKAGKERE